MSDFVSIALADGRTVVVGVAWIVSVESLGGDRGLLRLAGGGLLEIREADELLALLADAELLPTPRAIRRR